MLHIKLRQALVGQNNNITKAGLAHAAAIIFYTDCSPDEAKIAYSRAIAGMPNGLISTKHSMLYALFAIGNIAEARTELNSTSNRSADEIILLLNGALDNLSKLLRLPTNAHPQAADLFPLILASVFDKILHGKGAQEDLDSLREHYKATSAIIGSIYPLAGPSPAPTSSTGTPAEAAQQAVTL